MRNKEAGGKSHNQEIIQIYPEMTKRIVEKYIKIAIINMVFIHKHNEEWNRRYEKEKIGSSREKKITVPERKILLVEIKCKLALSGEKDGELENIVNV